MRIALIYEYSFSHFVNSKLKWKKAHTYDTTHPSLDDFVILNVVHLVYKEFVVISRMLLICFVLFLLLLNSS